LIGTFIHDEKQQEAIPLDARTLLDGTGTRAMRLAP
jgi:hypothetical protein